MPYDLSINDRFFLNQLIPKWETGKPFDLQADLKYVFHREKGSNYNEAQYEYTLKTLKAFLEDHRFARETRHLVFELLPKANMLMVKGSIENFEAYQELEKAHTSGQSSATRPAMPRPIQRRNDPYYDLSAQDDAPAKTGSRLLLLLSLGVIIVLCVIAWRFFNGGE